MKLQLFIRLFLLLKTIKMETLPDDMIIVIFDYITLITDKRQFLKTCKFYNNLTKKAFALFEKEFQIRTSYKKTQYCIGTYCKENFTIELCHDKYFDRIPQSFINRNNKVITRALVTYNCIELLEVAKENDCVLDGYIAIDAIKNRHWNILKWAKANRSIFNSVTSCTCAAKHGYLDILKWLRTIGCCWGPNTCAEAAKHGHLDVLIWASENRCDWNSFTCMYAAQNGHLNILIWAREHGCDWNIDVINGAIDFGHLEIIKWALSNGCECSINVCSRAVKKGNIEILKLLLESNCTKDKNICSFAVLNGRLDMLMLARQYGCVWNKETCALAAATGHLDIVKWIIKNGGEWDHKTCSIAALTENLDILKWARGNGCDWNSDTITLAAVGGNLDILIWAIENGCIFCPIGYNTLPKCNSHIIEWITNYKHNVNLPMHPSKDHYLILGWISKFSCSWDEINNKFIINKSRTVKF